MWFLKLIPVMISVVCGEVLTLSVRAEAPEQHWEGAAFTADPAMVIEAASPIPAAEDADVTVLLEEARVEFAPNGLRTTSTRLVFRIENSRAIQKWATVRSSWEPWREDRPELRARVICPDGAVAWLDPATIAESASSRLTGNLFDDTRILQAPLPAVTVGSVVEEEIVHREIASRSDRGAFGRFVFGRSVPVLRTRFVIDAPKSLPLRYEIRLLPSVEIQRNETSSQIRLTFENGLLEPHRRYDPFLPSDEPQWPYVAYSTARSWANVAEGYGELVDAQIELRTVEGLAREATRDTQDRAAVASQLLGVVQNSIRYAGVEFGSAAIVPRTPAETLERKYGDCKDQATLLVAMLRSVGVAAYVALLRAGPGPDVERDLPGVEAFDHAIVYVPGTPPLWIDPTHEFARVGQLPEEDQGRYALIANTGSAELIRTPETSPSDNWVIEEHEVILADEGSGKVIETTEWSGPIEQDVRQTYSQASESERREQLEFYASQAYSTESISDVAYSDPHDLSGPFRLSFEANGIETAQTDSFEAIVAIPIARLGAGTSVPEENRPTDFVLPEPTVSEWRYRVVPPPGFRARPLPESGVECFGPAELSREFILSKDGTVTVSLRFDPKKRRLTPDEAEKFRKGLEGLRESEPVLVTFEQIGEAHLAAGQVGEALREFRRLAALRPRLALHRIQIAMALLTGGMGEAARAEAREAIAVEPESATAYRTLGWILQHDLVGRRFGGGWVPEGAVEAYRKALELDPTDAVARADLAILLEHDASGNRYASKARLDEAIGHYRQLPGGFLVSERLEHNLPAALTWARRFGELRECVRARDASPETNSYLLLATAAIDGPEAAVAESRKLFASDEIRIQALREAGGRLMQLRLYREAADLLSAAANGASQGGTLLAAAGFVRGVRRYEDLPVPDSDPLSVVKRMLTAMFLDPSGDEFMSLLSRRTREIVLNGTEEQRLPDLMQEVRLTQGGQDIPVEFLIDTVLAALDASVDGEAEFGYRIGLRTSTGLGQLDEVIFVVPEDGRYRILATTPLVGLVGREVLSLANRGDLTGARRWLDWVRELESLPGGDDAFEGNPFPRFWTVGSAGGVDDIRFAAASLMADTPDPSKAVPILREGRKRAANEQMRLSFDLALLRAFQRLERYDDALPIAERLLEIDGDSPTAFMNLASALRKLSRWDELKRAAEERRDRVEADPHSLRILIEIATREGDFAKAERLFDRLVEQGRTEASDWNNRAWFALFHDSRIEEAVEHSERAVLLSNSQQPSALHTLAALYAEAGKTTEARQTILQAIDVRGGEEPRSEDWYVFGRIAEQYGENDAAAAAYLKVEPPEDEDPTSTYLLAQKRLAVLAAESD